MAVSGNSIALKSFQSFTINEGLLAKVVEAVKAGEKEARTSGDVKSFEVFYKGFRQNIAIGRIFIVPVKVCNNFKDFPISLLYGTVVRELNLGEEVADLIEKKIGETEFDEYSQLDIQKIKDTLFKDAESEEHRSLILFAPNWSNIREYVVFKFTEDDDKLSNLLRHQIFSAYFNPAVSSAFDALMTKVDTHKLDVTDITPKLTYPFITENPLKAYPDLVKQGNWTKPKVFLTAKTADAITKEILDPQELNVFEALDSALTSATMPETQSMEEVADFKGPDGSNAGNADAPQVDGEQPTVADLKDDTGATTGLRNRPDYGESDSYTAEANDANSKGASAKTAKDCTICGKPIILSPSAKERADRDVTGKSPSHYTNIFTTHSQCELDKRKKDTSDLMARKRKEHDDSQVILPNKGAADKTAGTFSGGFPASQNTSVGDDTTCHDCGQELDAFKTCPSTSSYDAAHGVRTCGGAGRKRQEKPFDPKSIASGKIAFNREATTCADCGKPLDALKMCPDAKSNRQFCGKPSDKPSQDVWVGGLYSEKTSSEAPFETPFTNVGPGTSAHDNANKAIAVAVDTISTKGEAPIGIELDDTGLPVHEKIASEIMRDLDGDGYVAMSTKSKAAAQKREDELNKKYTGRNKNANVPLTEDSIWSDLMKDFGEAPQVEIPGEGSSSDSSGDSDSSESEAPAAETKTEESKSEKKTEYKSKMFKDKSEPKEEKAEPKAEEPKEASAKTAFTFMNAYDIESARLKFAADPILGPATKFLAEFKEEVDSHSDGWSSWSAPIKAAAQLMSLIRAAEEGIRKGEKPQITIESLNKAMSPIKAFMTRRGLAAGMTMPKLMIKKASLKKADAVQPDYAEAKSKVVSPDTVDADIKQPTESVAEAAKVAGKHKHKCPECKETLICNNPKDCPGEGKPAKCGTCPTDGKKKKADDVSGDISEAKAKVVSPDTVDSDIKQPTKSVPEAAKVSNRPGDEEGCSHEWKKKDSDDKNDYFTCACGATKTESKKKGSDVSGDISEAKSEVVSPDTIDSDIKQPTESVEEAAKVASTLDTMELAQRLIDINDDIVKDIELHSGGGDLLEAVAHAIAGNEDTVSEYLDNREADDVEDVMNDGPDEEYMERYAAHGDDSDEAVEMGLADGDLADLGANLPSIDRIASVPKTAEAMYTSKNFKSKKDLKDAVALGKKITVYDPGFGMGGEAPPPDNGTVTVQGPHYPEPHRWYGIVTLKDGYIVGVK